MKMSTFTEEQIVQILREAETGEQTIGSVCRVHGISENTFAQVAQEIWWGRCGRHQAVARVGARKRASQAHSR